MLLDPVRRMEMNRRLRQRRAKDDKITEEPPPPEPEPAPYEDQFDWTYDPSPSPPQPPHAQDAPQREREEPPPPPPPPYREPVYRKPGHQDWRAGIASFLFVLGCPYPLQIALIAALDQVLRRNQRGADLPPRAPRAHRESMYREPAGRRIGCILSTCVLALVVVGVVENAAAPTAPPSPYQWPPPSPSSSDPAPSLPIPSAPAPSTPPDPLAGAWTGECFLNDGTEHDPDLQPDPACLDGGFKVVHVFTGTTYTSGCDGDDWNYSDAASDQVLCFTYLASSPAYHALVDQCVYGPSGSYTIWNFEPACQAGTFTVVGRYRGTTDTRKCGSYMGSEFPIRGYPDLDEILCLRMNFPLLGTVPINTCL